MFALYGARRGAALQLYLHVGPQMQRVNIVMRCPRIAGIFWAEGLAHLICMLLRTGTASGQLPAKQGPIRGTIKTFLTSWHVLCPFGPS